MWSVLQRRWPKAGSRGNSRRRDHAERTGGNCQRSGPVCDGCSFAAKRAALTVDLLVQNLSPHSNRGSEGAVTTRLYTNMDGMKGSKKIPCSTDGYSKEEAVEEAKRCIQCHCDECMKSCVYLREYKSIRVFLHVRFIIIPRSLWEITR